VKFSKIVITTAIMAVLSSVSVFAAPRATETPKTDTTQQKNHCEQKRGNEINKDRAKDKGSDTQIDPIERLKKKKAKVKELLDAGKITKEEADDLNARIDAKIKEIEEFNKLTAEQKREKLKKGLKEKIDKKVKEGKLSRDKADEIIKKFNKRIDEWDGKGYPGFMHKSYIKKHKCK
jgi:vacuolar-type H+-ATPase subunit I/STV1